MALANALTARKKWVPPLALFLLTACALRPTLASPTHIGSSPAPPGPTASALASASLAAPTAEATATPAPPTLVVCQTDEPLSLYLYGDDTTARAGIFDALFDGPIDTVGFDDQPVILESLPSLENGGAAVNQVEVRPGDKVVDAATGKVETLAEGVTLVQPDGSQITYNGGDPALTLQISARFTLKSGLLWSDGQPLTADDSLFSFEVDSSPATPHNTYLVDRTAQYEVEDARTVRWTGLPGWNDPNFFLRFWTPLPRHAYGQLTPAEMLTHVEVTERPLGWGPFVVAEWVKSDHLALARNPNYFRAPEGLPRVERVVFRFGLSSDQILTELLAGRCDVGSAVTDFSAQIPQLLDAQRAGTLAPQFVSSTAFEHLDFNLQPAEDYSPAAGREALQDARMRHALAYCLDRQALVDQLLNGLSEAPAAYLPATHPLYAADRATLYPFDPQQGQQLLTEAGWVDRDGDGVRENGKVKLVFNYVSGPPDSAFRQTLMELVESQLRANCGVDLQAELHTPEELYDPFPNSLLFGRKFDLGEFSWRTGLEPPCNLYLTEAIPSAQNPGGANDTGYSNSAFDEACRAARNALDAATRKAKHAEAQAIFTRDLPSLPLFWHVKAGVTLPRVTGYHLDPTANSDLWNVEALGLASP